MNEPINLTVIYDPATLRAGMASEWSDRWAFPKGVLGGGIFGAAVVIFLHLVVGFSPDVTHFVAFGIGALLVLALWARQAHLVTRRAIDQTLATLDGGRFDLTLAPEGITTRTGNSFARYEWSAVRDIRALPTATALMSGSIFVAVPDACLPEGLSPDAFRERLNAWKDAA